MSHLTPTKFCQVAVEQKLDRALPLNQSEDEPRVSSIVGPTQELAQNVCHRFGWSAVMEKNAEDLRWECTVTVGLNDTRRFRSDNTSNDSAARRKVGIAAASQVALDGLQEEIGTQDGKPVKTLSQVFSQPIDIYESNQKNWDYFWKHKPTAVGIDTEGNQSSPPVLVQISTDDYTIIEVPKEGRISRDLSRLLSDETVVKVFCDNYGHNDKFSLGLSQIPADLTVGHVVELESLASKLMGPVKVARGLARIVTLTMPELNVQVRKPLGNRRLLSVGRFIQIEQGKLPPLKSIFDLSSEELQYAALDSWCTLKAYKRLREADHSTA